MAKTLNQYATSGGADLYASIPKAVWAAIAVSALTTGGEHLDETRALVLAEWWTLYQNGIVPQTPYAA